MRGIAQLLSVLSVGFLISVSADPVFAKKGGNSGGKPKPPPQECNDTFPAFSYLQEATRKAPAEIYLASSDGCWRERVAVVSDMRGHPKLRMTVDGSEGVIVWTEEPNNTNYLVRRLTFTYDSTTKEFSHSEAVTLLPLQGEEAQEGEFLFYHLKDVWGDADLSSLYLALSRHRAPSSGEGTTDHLIYDLHNLSKTLDISPAALEWVCPPDVLYPQFVPTCYYPQGLRFNPSGTRLYIQDNQNDKADQRWDSILRLDIDRIDDQGVKKDLANWTFSLPELITASTYEEGGFGEPGGASPQPANIPSELPSPEIIGINYLDRTGNNTVGAGTFLNAELCDGIYAPLSGGNLSGGPNLWTGCEAVGPINGGSGSWESPQAYIYSTLGKRTYEIFRVYVDGESGLSGNPPQLLIENGRSADTGGRVLPD